MRSIFVVSLVVLVCCVVLSDFAPTTNVSAQRDDAGLARTIERLTDRRTDDLIPVQYADGTLSVNVEGRFQNVMLSRIDEHGEPVAACVTGLGEAYEFLGRDLKTGAPVSSERYRTAALSDAARHGMSDREFAFFRNMIQAAGEAPGGAAFSIINADSPDEGFNDPTAVTPEGGNNGTTRGQQRLNLFNFAGTIWGSFLDSTVTTAISGKFDPMTPCGAGGAVLGSAGNMSIFANFQNAPFQQTLYHGALANKLAGVDLGGVTGGAEIATTFNSSIDTGCMGGTRWYYGYDNSTPSGRINLLIVVLHEMGHGLGFAGFTNGSTGVQLAGLPDVYTRHLYDRSTGKFWPDMTNAERQASAINTGNVLWDGANVKAGSGFLTNGREASTGRVQVFTPNPVQGGSSISHFDSALSPSVLMEPAITFGLPLTLDLTRQQMRDIGWYRDANGDLAPDTITNVLPSGGSVGIGSNASITWTNTPGFNRNVTIELSTDGGTNYSPIASDIANTGSHTFLVPNTPTSQARVRVREHNFVSPMGSSSANFSIGTSSPPLSNAPFDYDGDGRTDVSTFRPSTGVWYLNRSTLGVTGFTWGTSTDKIAPADYDGDGKTDVAVFRPAEGRWYIFNSSTSTFSTSNWGLATDVPAPGDFDDDGRADVAIFRPSDGNWWLSRTALGPVAFRFGQSGDHPVVGDYDGDGNSDLAVFRPSNGVWYISRSSAGVIGFQFGIGTDKVTPADYDGDGRTDIAVYRPSEGKWYIVNSGSPTYPVHQFGAATDIPAPGDYDGDGRADIAIFRPSDGRWWINRTTAGLIVQQFGQNGDRPTPNAFGN